MGRSARWQTPQLQAELHRALLPQDPAAAALHVLRPALRQTSMAVVSLQPSGPETLFLIGRLIRLLVRSALVYRRVARRQRR
jgi:hypothetical protein